MRYSVVLPRIEKSDSAAVVRALEQAHLQWECGDRAAALELVRAASEAALAAGMDQRALVLTKATAALGREIEPGSRRPPAVTAAPPRSPKTLSLPDAGRPSAHEAKRMPSAHDAKRVPPAHEARRVPSDSAPPPTSPSVPVAKAARAGHARAPAAPAVVTARPKGKTSRPAPSIEVSGFDSPVESSDLVVTVASSDWETGLQIAVVGRRAERVVVTKTRRPDGTLEVRPLAPGEVAPAGARVALLVSLTD